MRTLFPEPRTENQHMQELAYQIGFSEGKSEGYTAGVAAAQADMREAQREIEYAMGIREELGA